MLNIAGAVLAGVIATILTIPVAQAAPLPAPIVVVGNDSGIKTTVTAPGHPGDGNPAVTVADAGSVIRCTYFFPGDDGQLYQEEQNGVPGRFYFVDCYRGSVMVSHDLTWIPDSTPPPVGAVQVTPATLAQQAVDELPLPLPGPKHNPDRTDGRPQTVTGMDTWWWLDAATFTPINHTVSAGPVWTTVTARPVQTFWRSGSADADDVVCDGPGTAYDTSRPPADQHSGCLTVYRRSSAGQPQTGPSPNDRFFTASVTVTWQVSWVGAGGTSGALPPISRTTDFPIAVAEVQTLNE